MPKISKNAGEDQAILNAKKQVAIHALNVGINGKLPTNSYFKEQHNIVAGTMQRALNLLSESDALSTALRGISDALLLTLMSGYVGTSQS